MSAIDPGALLGSYDPRPRGTTELLDAAFAVLRSDPPAAALFLVLPTCVLSAFDGAIEELGIAMQLAVGVAGSAALSLPGFVMLLLWAGRLRGERPTWSAAVAGALRRAPAVLLATTVSAALFYVGFYLLVVPGVYVVLALFVPSEVIGFERVGGIAALARSRTLMAGSKRRVLAPVLALVALRFVTYVPLGRGFYAAATVVGALGAAYLAALSFVTYVDTRARKEGFDLEILAARVAARTAAVEAPAASDRQAREPGDAA